MAIPSVKVDATIRHVQHQVGSLEAPTADDQVPDRERLGVFLDLVRRAGKETGFTVESVEMIESFLFRGGHMPELHIVAVQLPLEQHPVDRRDWKDHERQQGLHPEARSVDYYREPRNGL